jgi:hypothetical protein
VKIKASPQGLRDEMQFVETRRALTAAAVKRKLREVSFAIERRVKQEMPVDTGRARASWGHWTPGDLAGDARDAGPGDAEWKETAGGLEIEQGSNVEYVQYLNDGHSSQAPAGFIDRAEEHAQKILDAEIDFIMRGWIS